MFIACRDAAYIAVLTSVLSEAMSSPVLCLETLYENSVALVALEEIIGVREPRLACTKGYQAALRNTGLLLAKGGDTAVSTDFILLILLMLCSLDIIIDIIVYY